jgi:hypothetical protein
MKRISATLAPSRCSAENLRNYCKPSSQRGNGWDSRVPSNEPGTTAGVPILGFGSCDLTVRSNKPGRAGFVPPESTSEGTRDVRVISYAAPRASRHTTEPRIPAFTRSIAM